jgi:hypothetical protein
MQPTELNGRFNIPPAADGGGDGQEEETEETPTEPGDDGTDALSRLATEDVSYVVVERPKSKYRVRFYVQGRKQ